MGWCGEFGKWIDSGCGHPMVAGSASCTCAECGAKCPGRYNGCKDVWAAGPVKRGSFAGTTTPVSSPPQAIPGAGVPVPLGNGAGSPGLESRLRHLDTAVAQVSDDILALRKASGRPAATNDDDRLSRLEDRLDRLAVDLVEALRLMRPLPPALEAEQAQLDDLGQRVDDLGQGLSALQTFVTQQQVTLDRLTTAEPPIPSDRLEALRRARPAAGRLGDDLDVAGGRDPLGAVAPRRPLPPLSRPEPPGPSGLEHE